jgi:hypothetical protein
LSFAKSAAIPMMESGGARGTAAKYAAEAQQRDVRSAIVPGQEAATPNRTVLRA